MGDIDKIHGRIKKLLAMAADSSSPNEAAIAARRARQLMDEYQISVDDLKEKSGFGFAYVDKRYRFMPQWKSILAVAVARVNDCKASLYTHWRVGNDSYEKQILYQGFECDVRVAQAMYDYLTCAIDRLCAADQKRSVGVKYNAKIGNAYKMGATSELVKRLHELMKVREQELLMHGTSTSLVVYKVAAVEQEFGKIKTANVSIKLSEEEQVARAIGRGMVDAESINLDKHLGSQAQSNMLR